MIAHCELMGDRVAILDPPPAQRPADQGTGASTRPATTRSSRRSTGRGSRSSTRPSGTNRFVPPCGHMAGIWARNDDTRGVHKAPANEVVRGAISLQTQITKAEHDLLNPVGINCIRSFPGRGIRVWGARTLSSDPAWRYLNVRRLFNYLEESILDGTQWVVFEPNDPALWARIRRTITAFLVNEWRKGALFGSRPTRRSSSSATTRPTRPRASTPGQVVCEIGVAPVKPAEFVIFQLRSSPAAPASSPNNPSSKGASTMALADVRLSAGQRLQVTIDGIEIPKVIEVSGLKNEVDKIELKQQTERRQVRRPPAHRPAEGRGVHGHPRPDRQQDDHRLAEEGRWRATSPARARPRRSTARLQGRDDQDLQLRQLLGDERRDQLAQGRRHRAGHREVRRLLRRSPTSPDAARTHGAVGACRTRQADAAGVRLTGGADDGRQPLRTEFAFELPARLRRTGTATCTGTASCGWPRPATSCCRSTTRGCRRTPPSPPWCCSAG